MRVAPRLAIEASDLEKVQVRTAEDWLRGIARRSPIAST
jgi:hypothetical protein